MPVLERRSDGTTVISGGLPKDWTPIFEELESDTQAYVDAVIGQVEIGLAEAIAEGTARVKEEVEADLEAEAIRIDADIDSAIAVAESGRSANALAITAATNSFTAGLATKSKHTLSPNLPGATPNNAGDVWERHKAGDPTKIISRWRGAGGTSWTSMDLDATYIPLLDIGSGTFGDLSGTRILAQSIGTKQLLVANLNNELEDPYLVSGDLRGWPTSSGWDVVSTTGGPGNALHCIATGTYKYVINGAVIACEPGEQFAFGIRINNNCTSAQSVIYGQNKTGGAEVVALNTGAFPVATWADRSWSFVVPDGVYQLRPRFIVNASSPAGQEIWIANPWLRRKNGGELIVDGSVKASQLDADFINGIVLTGSLFRTTATPNRGIQIVSDVNGNFGSLIAYDGTALANATFTLNGQTGAVSIRGDLGVAASITGATITAGVFQTQNTGVNAKAIRIAGNKLIAYNVAGTQAMLTVDGDAGTIALRGDLSAGSVITGATIRTAPSGERIEMATAAAGTLSFYTGHAQELANKPGGIYVDSVLLSGSNVLFVAMVPPRTSANKTNGLDPTIGIRESKIVTSGVSSTQIDLISDSILIAGNINHSFGNLISVGRVYGITETGTMSTAAGWAANSSVYRSGNTVTLRVNTSYPAAATAANASVGQLFGTWRPAGAGRHYFTATDGPTGSPISMWIDDQGVFAHSVSRPAGAQTLGSFTFVCA